MLYRVSVPLVALFASMLVGCGLLGGAGAGDGDASLTVVNQSDLTICEVQVAPSARASASTARSQLGPDEAIGPGEWRTFHMRRDRYDVRMSDCRGRPLYGRRAVAVVGDARIDFRVVEVQRRGLIGARRFAGAARGARF